MKKYLLLTLISILTFNLSFSQPGYQPTEENLKNREWFLDNKFGLFVRWRMGDEPATNPNKTVQAFALFF
jgi:hypothetical protein